MGVSGSSLTLRSGCCGILDFRLLEEASAGAFIEEIPVTHVSFLLQGDRFVWFSLASTDICCWNPRAESLQSQFVLEVDEHQGSGPGHGLPWLPAFAVDFPDEANINCYGSVCRGVGVPQRHFARVEQPLQVLVEAADSHVLRIHERQHLSDV